MYALHHTCCTVALRFNCRYWTRTDKQALSARQSLHDSLSVPTILPRRGSRPDLFDSDVVKLADCTSEPLTEDLSLD